ncbi:small secreted hydrophilic protein [Streptomyces sp. NPDC007929]|uniref:small secreted hydrophilic protein n=1 Tax=unclassified Streptomyces TaxID=2593676 RepID=UPI0036ED47F4
MVFSRRMAALSAVVLIPLGIAATSYALADRPESPRVPSQKVELEHGSPTPTLRPGQKATPGDEVVSRPPVTDSSASDDDDDGGQGSGDDGRGDDEPGDDGPGDDG